MAERFDPDEVSRFENATWSRCADGYLDGFGPLVSEALQPLLEEIEVGEGDRVLDVGTGPGLAAAAAAARGARVVGIDFSEPMLREARKNHPELELREASADALPFEDGTLDAVLGNFVLHHCGRPGEVLAEACRVLRPGGRAAFTVWSDPAKLEAFGLFLAAVEDHAGAADLPHGPLFGVSDLDVYRDLVRSAGFRESDARELEIAWQTPSLDPFLAAFRDWANLDAFPSELCERIESTVRERAAAYFRDGVYVMPNPAILVSGVK